MSQPPTKLPNYPTLFPPGVVVKVIDYPPLYGHYMGNGGKRWDGQKHRVKLADGRSRYIYGEFLVRPGHWKRIAGDLRKWEIAQSLEEIGKEMIA